MSFFRLAQRVRLLFAGLCLLLSLPPALAAEVDPPGRVARLNLIEGTLSFAPAGSQDWSAAVLNRPLTDGDRLWVEKASRAELHVGATALRLGGSSSLEVLRLDDYDLRLKLTQGSLLLRVHDYPEDEEIEVATPNVGFVLSEPGEYRIDVDPDRGTTTLSVRRGAGKAYGADDNREPQRLRAGQRVRFDGEDLFMLENGSVGPRDEFERWAALRDDREESSRSARYVSRDMTGYEDLDAHGDWREVSGYGPVWTPRVTISGWAPYHHGHWAWVAPWGWTWVDDAPWGFAPFHYGRWAHIEGAWCWVPGQRVRRPVYAPALVVFAGSSGSSGWSLTLGSGLSGVAWFALGPNEPYRPAYSRNPAYLERLNHRIDIHRHIDVYVNHRAPHSVAVMPERDFQRGARVRPDESGRWQRDPEKMRVHESLPLAPGRESRHGGAEIRRDLPASRVFQREVVGERAILQRGPVASTQPGQNSQRDGNRGDGRADQDGRFERRFEPRNETREQPRRPDERGRREDEQRRQDRQRGEQQQTEQQRQLEQRRQEQQRAEQQQAEQLRQREEVRRRDDERGRREDEQRRQDRQRGEQQQAEQQRQLEQRRQEQLRAEQQQAEQQRQREEVRRREDERGRREDEQRRQERQRNEQQQAEQQRQMEQRRQEQQRAEQQQGEQQRQREEVRRREEERGRREDEQRRQDRLRGEQQQAEQQRQMEQRRQEQQRAEQQQAEQRQQMERVREEQRRREDEPRRQERQRAEQQQAEQQRQMERQRDEQRRQEQQRGEQQRREQQQQQERASRENRREEDPGRRR